jgi:hypothetical protein
MGATDIVIGDVNIEPDNLSRSIPADDPKRFENEVETLIDQFDLINQEIQKGGVVIAMGLGKMIPALDLMERFLSRKGEDHNPHYIELLIAAGLPTWTEYLDKVAAAFEISVRTIQRQLEDHRGHPKERQTRRLPGGKGSGKGSSKASVKLTEAQAIAVKNLAEARKKFGTSAAAGNEQAAAILAEYEQAVTSADSSTLTNEDNSTPDRRVVINPTESEFACVRPGQEGFLFAAPPVAEPEKVAAPPDKIDPSVSALNAEPDWKQVLVELVAVLEQYGDRLPLVVLREKRKIESLLAGDGHGRPDSSASSTPTKRYNKVMKLDAEGNRRWTVVAEGEQKAWGSFEIESDADNAVEHLCSPATSLVEMGA